MDNIRILYVWPEQATVEFDWDRANAAHIARHRVTPDEAEQALLNDPFDVNYEVVGGEERWTSLGHTSNLRVLVVVWSLRGDAIQVITARAAGKRLRSAYLRRKGLYHEAD